MGDETTLKHCRNGAACRNALLNDPAWQEQLAARGLSGAWLPADTAHFRPYLKENPESLRPDCRACEREDNLQRSRQPEYVARQHRYYRDWYDEKRKDRQWMQRRAAAQRKRPKGKG